jgi:hypothetical protein
MMRPGISARVYFGSGRPDDAQASSVTCQTMATRSPEVPWRTMAASVCSAVVVNRPGQLARLRARSCDPSLTNAF